MIAIDKRQGSKIIASVAVVLVACAALCILKMESYNVRLERLAISKTENIVDLNTRYAMRSVLFTQYQYYKGEALKEYAPAAKEYIDGMVKSCSDSVINKDNQIKLIRNKANTLQNQEKILNNNAAIFRKAAAILVVGAVLCAAILVFL